MSEFYKKLTSEYDKDLVDAVLAVSAKKAGIPESAFNPEVFCRTFVRLSSPEYRAQIENVIAEYDSSPYLKHEKLEALKKALKDAQLNSFPAPYKVSSDPDF